MKKTIIVLALGLLLTGCAPTQQNTASLQSSEGQVSSTTKEGNILTRTWQVLKDADAWLREHTW